LVLNANASGTPKGRAKDFLAGFQGILARKRAKFCFGGGGSKSETILTNLFCLQNKKNFCYTYLATNLLRKFILMAVFGQSRLPRLVAPRTVI
jgi:hypothetical protein